MRPQLSREWTVHCLAECQECEWGCTDYTKARDAARAHYKKTGHLVHGERGTAFRYGLADRLAAQKGATDGATG